MKRRRFLSFAGLAMVVVALTWGIGQAGAQLVIPQPIPNPLVDYNAPNYAYSPIIPKFVDPLPGLWDPKSGTPQPTTPYIQVANPDTTTYPGSDYYEIGLKDYTQTMHSSLPKATRLRGYYQKNNGTTGATDKTSHYLGPLIVAKRGTPVRLKMFNELPLSNDPNRQGNLFVPVDTTIMGAGLGPDGVNSYTQNRTIIHLHGGFTPWVSDGTPHQWITPPGDPTVYKKGVSFRNVPDMPESATGTLSDGVATHFYSNQQSGRLMFYHDHVSGLTRLNAYAGKAAGYLLYDDVELGLITSGILPNQAGLPAIYTFGIPLVIQDKTFVSNTTATTDPLWNSVEMAKFPVGAGVPGDLWFPHVYQPNQMPLDGSVNPKGRWDYGPWFWPPIPITEPTLPTTSVVPESFMDTAMVNGAAYPYVQVGRQAYRFRILNACNDRFLNLQLYYADDSGPVPAPVTVPSLDPFYLFNLTAKSPAGTEVSMVGAYGQTYTVNGQPVTVAHDGRWGGVPDPRQAGPAMIQIGTEGGLLPAPVVHNAPPKPLDFDMDRRSATFGFANTYTLLLGPAERADVIIDFSQVPDGAKLILYNDAAAPFSLFDPRYDFFTGNPDYSDTGLGMGGAPSTQVGMGPNTRTIMQFRVSGPQALPYPLVALQAALPGAYAASHNTVDDPQYIVTPGLYADNRFASIIGTPTTWQGFPVFLKTIVEDFDAAYGRMNALLGTERTSLDPAGQNAFGYKYIDPATEVIPEGQAQVWALVHNGIDTHAIHFHLVNVQVINRVDWAGIVKPPDDNELGWKETVRMNPLENVVVAMRPTKPALTFGIPKSQRLLNPTALAGSTADFTNPGPNGLPTTNVVTDFGWEYVWHCHLLGHEENDMMRPFVMQVTTAVPGRPTGLGATALGGGANRRVRLNWTDPTPAAAPATLNNPANEVGFEIQRATNATFTQNRVSFAAPANATIYINQPVTTGTRYYYRIRAFNASGNSNFSNSVNIRP